MTITIPSKVLRLPVMPGEKAEAVTPEANDPVSFHCEGVVKNCVGDNCEVEIRFVNGERPEGGDQSEEGESVEKESEEEANLTKMASEADAEEYK